MNDQILSEHESSPSPLSIPLALGLGLILLAIDFGSKALANARLPLDRMVHTLLPFFSWRLTYNTGSHYILGPVGEWVPYRLMMGIAALAVIGLITMLARDVRLMPHSTLRTVQWLLIATLTGALGNALEVVALGRATDFFMLQPFPWPANLCDQFVNVSVFFLLPLSLVLAWRMDRNQLPPKED